MTAKVRSQSLGGHRPKEGQSTGSCKLVKTPRGVNSANSTQATLTIPQVASSKMTGIKSYKCKLNSREERGWIPEEIVFSIDAGKARARAYGPIIHQAKEQPVDVGFKTTRNGEHQMNWKLSLLRLLRIGTDLGTPLFLTQKRKELKCVRDFCRGTPLTDPEVKETA